ncbi:Cytochrome P450 52A3-B [Cladobotryum mycophilum]|uniref:Cytochrome P450 52A3-B n=1 Tax=Cladobotryum mycophilum TaxID=491253 RepID=A0ABR0SYX9_9HYPO
MSLIKSIISFHAFTTSISVLGVITVLVWIRHLIADIRIKRAGGVRAPVLAGNLFSASRFYYHVGKNQYQNTLLDLLNSKLDDLPSGRRGFAEFSLTGAKRVLITRDPEQIKTILATKFAHFGHGHMWHDLWRPFLGDGIFATDGKMWHDSRQMIRPMFLKDRVRNIAIFDACTDKLLSKLPSPGTTVDLKDFFYRWTLDTMTEFLLGENVNSLDSPDNEIAHAMYVAQRAQMYIMLLNPIAPLIPKGDYYQAIRKIEQFIEPVIARTIALPEGQLEELSKSDMDFTFLHSIARFSRDPKTIRDQIMSVLLAGRDTTAATLSWAIYELSNYPSMWARLREEVLGVLGCNGTPSYEALKNMTYLKNIINETLRLHPAVPINMRTVLETTTVPNRPGKPDIVLLKGDSVTINTLGLHTREDLYPRVGEICEPQGFQPRAVGELDAQALDVYAVPRWAKDMLVRFAQRFERIEYRGVWEAQSLQADIIGTPALGVPVALFEPSYTK